MKRKRSHAGVPWEAAVPPYGLCYENNGIPLISVSEYCKKYGVPSKTVYFWINKKRIHGVYQSGHYGIRDIHPRYMYRKDCYYEVQKN